MCEKNISKDHEEDNILLSFKDDDRIVLRKKVNNSLKVGEIRKINPDTNSLWVEINFDNIPLLEHVELFSYEMTGIRLTYSMDLRQLVSESIDEDIWIKRVKTLESEIWKKDKEMMSILETTKLAVNWGGPDSIQTSAEGELLYYFDNSIGYINAQRNTKTRNEIDNITLEQIYKKALEFSLIVKELISKTLSGDSQ